jgi:hypothetical protein
MTVEDLEGKIERFFAELTNDLYVASKFEEADKLCDLKDRLIRRLDLRHLIVFTEELAEREYYRGVVDGNKEAADIARLEASKNDKALHKSIKNPMEPV